MFLKDECDALLHWLVGRSLMTCAKNIGLLLMQMLDWKWLHWFVLDIQVVVQCIPTAPAEVSNVPRLLVPHGTWENGIRCQNMFIDWMMVMKLNCV